MKLKIIGETLACFSMFALLFELLVFGSAMMAEDVGMHSEAVYAEARR